LVYLSELFGRAAGSVVCKIGGVVIVERDAPSEIFHPYDVGEVIAHDHALPRGL
jgi:hypothetical protein